MKPNFTLSLSFEGIRLLRRASGGWRAVGEVALDAEDMVAELAVLRRTATALEPGGLRSKLLLPSGQIKYLTINTAGMDTAARRAAARTALDGATPYAVEDLAFDLSPDGDQTHIAAVAKETLAEAEAFANEHRFYPVYFAAVPEDSAFLGEPFFGQTSVAKEILGPDETLEPDGIAVVVIGDVDFSKVHPTPMENETSPDEPELAPQDAANPAPREAPSAAPAEVISASDVELTAKPNKAVDPTPPQPKAAVPPSTPAPVLRDETPVVPPIPTTPLPEAVPPSPKLGAPQRDTASPKAPTVAAPQKNAGVGAPISGFASRRKPEKGVTPVRVAPKVAPPTAPKAPPPLAAPSVKSQTEPVAAPVVVQPDSTSLKAAPPKKEPVTGFLSRRKAKAPKQQDVQPAPKSKRQKPRSEAERMTVFGARKSGEVGGKPRFLGLVLTTALLVFLAGVAAWASVFLDDGLNLSRLFGDRAPIETATVAQPQNVTPAPKAVQTASLEPTLTEEDSAVLDALQEPVGRVLSRPEIEAHYATTGIWAQAPAVPPEPAGLIDLDDLYLTSIDPITSSTDAIALPPVATFASDSAMASITAPIAPGTTFALDERGLVIPTPEGALSPQGALVFLGRPEIVPPTTPNREETAPKTVEPGSQLAAFRPKERPGDLAENTERAQLDGLTRSELAGLRPQLRPASQQEQAQQTAASETETEEAPIESAAAAPEDAFESATARATEASVRPDTRPRNFARIVKRAQETAQPKAETVVASAAAIAPRTVTPKVPSKSSVARQATVKNAINLNKVNLIGVYGKPSSRRALVRLSNGRYQKVVVGDRIDGGRVSAIGDSELRYSKSGRNVVLKMPRG